MPYSCLSVCVHVFVCVRECVCVCACVCMCVHTECYQEEVIITWWGGNLHFSFYCPALPGCYRGRRDSITVTLFLALPLTQLFPLSFLLNSDLLSFIFFWLVSQLSWEISQQYSNQKENMGCPVWMVVEIWCEFTRSLDKYIKFHYNNLNTKTHTRSSKLCYAAI